LAKVFTLTLHGHIDLDYDTYSLNPQGAFGMLTLTYSLVQGTFAAFTIMGLVDSSLAQSVGM
jgi:hypothetical protein